MTAHIHTMLVHFEVSRLNITYNIHIFKIYQIIHKNAYFSYEFHVHGNVFRWLNVLSIFLSIVFWWKFKKITRKTLTDSRIVEKQHVKEWAPDFVMTSQPRSPSPFCPKEIFRTCMLRHLYILGFRTKYTSQIQFEFTRRIWIVLIEYWFQSFFIEQNVE